MVQFSHPYMTTGKTIALTRQTFVGKVISLLFNMLSRFVIAFLPRSSFMAEVTTCSDFGAQEYKVYHCFHCFPIYFPWSDGTRWDGTSDESDALIFVFWMLSFKPAFSLSSFTFIKRFFSSSLPSAIKGCVIHLHILRLLIFLLAWFQLVLHPAWHFAWCTLHVS